MILCYTFILCGYEVETEQFCFCGSESDRMIFNFVLCMVHGDALYIRLFISSLQLKTAQRTVNKEHKITQENIHIGRPYHIKCNMMHLIKLNKIFSIKHELKRLLKLKQLLK